MDDSLIQACEPKKKKREKKSDRHEKESPSRNTHIPVNVLPAHAPLVKAADALREAPVLRRDVARDDVAAEVHRERGAVAVHELDGPEMEELAAPAAAADLAEARAAPGVEGGVPEVQLQSPLVQLAQELILLVPQPRQHPRLMREWVRAWIGWLVGWLVGPTVE